MAILDNFKALFGRNRSKVKAQSGQQSLDALLAIATGGRAGGSVISRESAIRFSVLARAVNLVSEQVAHLVASRNLRILDREGDYVPTQRSDSRFTVAKRLLVETPDNGITISYNMLCDVMMDYCLDGNGYLVITRDTTNTPIALTRVKPDDVEVVQDTDGFITYHITTSVAGGGTGTVQELLPQEVVHVRWPTMAMNTGTFGTQTSLNSPLAVLTPALRAGLAADEFVNIAFSTATGNRLVAVYPDGINLTDSTPEQQEHIATQLVSKLSDPGSIVAFNGVNIQEVQHQPVTTPETNNARNYQREDIAGFYGVPPGLISGDTAKLGSSVLELKRLWIDAGLRLHLDALLKPLSMRMLPRGHDFEVDMTELLRGNTSEMGALAATLMGNGQTAPIATREEARRLIGMPRTPVGEFVDPPMAPVRQDEDSGDSEE